LPEPFGIHKGRDIICFSEIYYDAYFQGILSSGKAPNQKFNFLQCSCYGLQDIKRWEVGMDFTVRVKCLRIWLSGQIVDSGEGQQGMTDGAATFRTKFFFLEEPKYACDTSRISATIPLLYYPN
jgi:hypothetical protein